MTTPPGDMPYHALIIKHIGKQAQRIRDDERDRNILIREAFHPARRKRYGYTVDDIAEAAGLSRPRIYQLIKEAKDA